MKNVFNNDELCHIFAAQSQESGRNQGNNLFFEGKKIWSHGSHYLLAQIYDNCILVNEHSYSMTTCQHRSSVMRAFNYQNIHLVPDVDDGASQDNIDYFENKIWDNFGRLIRSNKVSGWDQENFMDAIKEYNSFCKSFKIKKTIKLSDEYLNLLDEIISFKKETARLREIKNNTPEEIERKVNAAQRKKGLEIKKDRVKKIKTLKDVCAWKRGGRYIRTSTIFLRVKESSVETSQGASAPLEDSIKLLYKIDQKIKANGDSVGEFTVNHVNDVKVRIGCHLIYFKEAYRTIGHLLTLYKEMKKDRNFVASPNRVNVYAYDAGIDLTSCEVVALSNIL